MQITMETLQLPEEPKLLELDESKLDQAKIVELIEAKVVKAEKTNVETSRQRWRPPSWPRSLRCPSWTKPS